MSAVSQKRTPRPTAYRDPGYEENFDYTTVFCDAFWIADRSEIILIGPSLLYQSELGLQFVSLPTETSCRYRVWYGDRVDRIEVKAPSETQRLLIQGHAGLVVIEPQPNGLAIFRGKRVLQTTISDNNILSIRSRPRCYVLMGHATSHRLRVIRSMARWSRRQFSAICTKQACLLRRGARP